MELAAVFRDMSNTKTLPLFRRRAPAPPTLSTLDAAPPLTLHRHSDTTALAECRIKEFSVFGFRRGAMPVTPAPNLLCVSCVTVCAFFVFLLSSLSLLFTLCFRWHKYTRLSKRKRSFSHTCALLHAVMCHVAWNFSCWSQSPDYHQLMHTFEHMVQALFTHPTEKTLLMEQTEKKLFKLNTEKKLLMHKTEERPWRHAIPMMDCIAKIVK